MQILFLIIPVVLLGATALAHLWKGTLASVKPALATDDQRGITLQTVIITAVMALAAAGAGVVIYNVVRNRGDDINANAQNVCETDTPLVQEGAAVALAACATE